MRRKRLISPEKPVQDSIEYRSRLLFLPTFSYAIAIAISFAFLGGIFTLTQVKSAMAGIVGSIILLLVLLIIETLLAYILTKISDVILTLEGISGFNWWYRRTYTNWKQVTLIKPSNLLGIRYLSIKTTDGKSILLTTHFYKTVQMLDRVRELAGEEHIFVRALEKELSRPRYELTKVWCWVIGSIALTISIYLIGENMYAAEQEKPLEQAIASYVRQHPKTAPNHSAIELQALMTKLGLSVDAFGDGSNVKVKPEKAAIAEWKGIEPTFIKYLEKQKTQESIEPIPDRLSSYLKIHQADLEAIETHLMNSPIPQWGADSAWVEKSDPKGGDSPFSKGMNSFNLVSIENLMIINILGKYAQPNADISRDLAGIEKIQQSTQSQLSLLGQLISRIEERRIAQIVRQVDLIPNGWGDNLFILDRHKQMLDTIEKQSMINFRGFHSPDFINELWKETNSPLRFIPGYYYLLSPHIRLNSIDWHDKVRQGLVYWENQNICRTDGKIDSAFWQSVLEFERYAYAPAYLTNLYHTVLRSDLRWEGVTSSRQVKAKLAAGEKVDRVAKEFNLPSQVCPGENWTAKAKDGAVSIEFSHPPDWIALGVHPIDIDPLTYKIKPIDRG